MSDEKDAPRATTVEVTQIAAVAFASADANYCTLFALCSDGSLWRLQEWRSGEWDRLSLPPVVTPPP